MLDVTPERPEPATLLEKKLWHRCFPVKFVKFSGTHFSQSTSERLQWLIKYELLIVRSSHQKCSLKKGVLKKFTKFTGKYPSRVSYLIKFQERCFLVDFEKVFKSTFFTEHLWTTASLSSAFCCTLGHFFINKNLCACTLLGFKLIQKNTHTNLTR